MSFANKGFLTTDSLIGIIITAVMIQLCHLCVNVSVHAEEQIRRKIMESEQNYEYAIRTIGDCIVCKITDEEDSSSTNS